MATHCYIINISDAQMGCTNKAVKIMQYDRKDACDSLCRKSQKQIFVLAFSLYHPVLFGKIDGFYDVFHS